MQFDIDITRLSTNKEDEDAIYKVSLKGELTFNLHRDFSSAMSDLIQKGIRKIIIDFNDLDMIDSVGIGILIKYEKQLQKENGELVLTRCSDQILNLFIPVNLEKLIKIFKNLDDAMNYFT